MTIDEIKGILPPSLILELGSDEAILKYYNENIATKQLNSSETISFKDICKVVPPIKIQELKTEEAIRGYYSRFYVKSGLEFSSKKIIMYHGSNIIVKEPHIYTNGFNKDFGFGFYLTNKKTQAESWAARKALGKKGYISVFEVDIAYREELNNKKFDGMTDEWLDFIAACRYGKSHNYDTVEGPMADDTIYRIVSDYFAGEISREDFMSFCMFRYPTHQLVMCTQKALEYLKFKEAYYV